MTIKFYDKVKFEQECHLQDDPQAPVPPATEMCVTQTCLAAPRRSELRTLALSFCSTKQDHVGSGSIDRKYYYKEKWVMPRNDSKKIGVDWVTGVLIKWITEWMNAWMSAWSPVTDMTIIRNHYFDTLKRNNRSYQRENVPRIPRSRREDELYWVTSILASQKKITCASKHGTCQWFSLPRHLGFVLSSHTMSSHAVWKKCFLRRWAC